MIKLYGMLMKSIIEYPNWMLGVDFVLTMLVFAAIIAAVVVWFDARKDYSLYYKDWGNDDEEPMA